MYVLLPAFLHIVNSSISLGDVSDLLKEALVTSLLKKNNLDPEQLKNFTPVSNTPFASKLVERAVASRLNNNISEHGFYEILQSAFKKHHITETALLWMNVPWKTTYVPFLCCSTCLWRSIRRTTQ